MDNKILMTLLWIDFILPVVIMVALIRAHNRVIRTNNVHLFLRLEFVAILIGVVLTFFGAYTAFSAAGPGAILCSESFVMGLITAFVLFDRRSLKQEREIVDNKIRWHQTVLKLSLVFAQLMPAFASNAFYNACDSLHVRQAKPLIQAIGVYFGNNNDYPDDLEVLVPEYISEIPLPVCLQPYDWMGKFDRVGMETHYSMLVCGDKELLAVSATILGFVNRYDFSNQTWSSADFLDGYCSGLE